MRSIAVCQVMNTGMGILLGTKNKVRKCTVCLTCCMHSTWAEFYAGQLIMLDS